MGVFYFFFAPNLIICGWGGSRNYVCASRR